MWKDVKLGIRAVVDGQRFFHFSEVLHGLVPLPDGLSCRFHLEKIHPECLLDESLIHGFGSCLPLARRGFEGRRTLFRDH